MRTIFESIWIRIFVPLLFIGVNGLSINMIAWAITQGGVVDYSVILKTIWTYLYLGSGIALAAFEIIRSGYELREEGFYLNIMNELKPDLVQQCRSMIKSGNIADAITNINNTKKIFKFPK